MTDFNVHNAPNTEGGYDATDAGCRADYPVSLDSIISFGSSRQPPISILSGSGPIVQVEAEEVKRCTYKLDGGWGAELGE